IAEDVARERGHMEVNVELFQKVEALGDEKLQEAPPLPWTEGAQARLQQKIAQSPAIAMDFVADMVKRDTEERTRELGLTAFDAALEKTRRLQGNPQAVKRLEEIRQHFKDPHTKKPEGGTLGAELMQRFRRYLKGEEKL